MAISTILNPEAQEFIPQNNSLLQSHPPPFTYTQLFLPPSTPMISFYNTPPPPPPPSLYFAATTHCYCQYQYYSTLPRPLLDPERHLFSANYSDFLHTPPSPLPPPSNPSERLNRAQISVELKPGLGGRKLAEGPHPRGRGRGKGPCGFRRSPTWRRGGGGGGRGGDLGSRGRRLALKEEVSSLGVVNNSSSEEEYCCSVHKFPRIVEPREMVGKRKKPVVPVDEGGDRTTVMIRNIPNKYTRELLIDFLDEHCQMENQKAEREAEGGDAIISAYDFVYLPLDLRRKANLGYAFVNFTSPRAVWKFKVATNNQRWELFYSSKIRQIATAKYQGKEALMRHFEQTVFACDSNDFLPVVFSPPRDGSGKAVTQEFVGGRIAPRPYGAQLHKTDPF